MWPDAVLNRLVTEGCPDKGTIEQRSEEYEGVSLIVRGPRGWDSVVVMGQVLGDRAPVVGGLGAVIVS